MSPDQARAVRRAGAAPKTHLAQWLGLGESENREQFRNPLLKEIDSAIAQFKDLMGVEEAEILPGHSRELTGLFTAEKQTGQTFSHSTQAAQPRSVNSSIETIDRKRNTAIQRLKVLSLPTLYRSTLFNLLQIHHN
jgi:hypothetical protein